MTKILGFEFRPELYYNENIWAKVEPDGNVRVGFDDVVAKGSHDIFALKLSDVGTVVKYKGKIGLIESRKYTGPIVCPVNGTIIKTNDEVRKYGAEGFMNDPYGEGWLAIIKPSNLEEDLKKLLFGQPAVEWYTKEADKAKEELDFDPSMKGTGF